jgi:hypothetical protein
MNILKKISIYGVVGFCVLQIQNVQAIFLDISNTHQNFESVNYVRSEGIVSGYSDGKYKPEKKINRAELIKIIINATMDETEIYGEHCFPDIDGSEQWFSKYVCTAERKNIVSGYPDGSFQAVIM